MKSTGCKIYLTDHVATKVRGKMQFSVSVQIKDGLHHFWVPVKIELSRKKYIEIS